MPSVGSKLDKLCTEMKPAHLCTSTPVQHRYIESCSVLLVQFDFWGRLMCFFPDTFITHFWKPTTTSTSERIFDIFMVEITNQEYVLYNIEVKQCFKSFHVSYNYDFASM